MVEVLSRGTSKHDRTAKWDVYRGLPSLRHEVLITAETAKVEVFDRNNDTWSEPRVAAGLKATLLLPAIDVSIPLDRIYWDVLTS